MQWRIQDFKNGVANGVVMYLLTRLGCCMEKGCPCHTETRTEVGLCAVLFRG